jgi:hypothetical protein
VETGSYIVEITRYLDDFPYRTFGGICAMALWDEGGRNQNQAEYFDQSQQFIQHYISPEQSEKCDLIRI